MELINLFRPVHQRYPISSPFGKERLLKINGIDTKNVHKGIDFACPVGTEVRAMVDGSIFKLGWEFAPDAYPNDYHSMGMGYRLWQLFEWEGKKVYAWYGHLASASVRLGCQIRAGEIIGQSGQTGRSTGPHLHVQFRIVDTNEYLNASFTA